MDLQWWVGSQSNLGRHTSDTLHLGHTVYHSVPSSIQIRLDILFFASTEVQSADELTDNDHVDAPGDLGF